MLDIFTYEISLELKFRVDIFAITASPPVKLCASLLHTSALSKCSSDGKKLMVHKPPMRVERILVMKVFIFISNITLTNY
jgi:hypothetical protein